MECLNENVSTWLVVFDYVEPDVVPDLPSKVIRIEVILTTPETKIKRLKIFHTPSSSNRKSSIGQQFSKLIKEDKNSI